MAESRLWMYRLLGVGQALPHLTRRRCLGRPGALLEQRPLTLPGNGEVTLIYVAFLQL